MPHNCWTSFIKAVDSSQQNSRQFIKMGILWQKSFQRKITWRGILLFGGGNSFNKSCVQNLTDLFRQGCNAFWCGSVVFYCVNGSDFLFIVCYISDGVGEQKLGLGRVRGLYFRVRLGSGSTFRDRPPSISGFYS